MKKPVAEVKNISLSSYWLSLSAPFNKHDLHNYFAYPIQAFLAQT